MLSVFQQYRTQPGQTSSKETKNLSSFFLHRIPEQEDNQDNTILIIGVDVSASMWSWRSNGEVIVRLNTIIQQIVMDEVSDVYIIPFGVKKNRFQTQINEFPLMLDWYQVLTPDKFLELFETINNQNDRFRDFCFYTGATDTYKLVEGIEELHKRHPQKHFQLTLISDGEFSDFHIRNPLVTSFPSWRITELQLLLCNNDIQHVQQRLGRNFSEVLKLSNTLLTFERMDYSFEQLLKRTPSFKEIEGFFSPFIVNGTGVYLSMRNELMNMPYPVFRDSLHKQSEWVPILRDLTHKIAVMFFENPSQACRVASNKSFTFWWKILMKFFTDKMHEFYDEEIKMMKDQISNYTELRSFFQETRQTNILQLCKENFLNSLRDLMISKGVGILCIYNNGHYFDGNITDMMNDKSRRNIGKIIAFFEYLEEMVHESEGVLVLDPDVLEEMNNGPDRIYVNQYISLLLNEILGIGDSVMVSGVSLFLNILIILYSEEFYEDLGLKYNSIYQEHIKPIFVWWVSHHEHHKVDFDDKMNKSLQDFIGFGFFQTYLSLVIRDHPETCSDEFKKEFKDYMDAKAVTTLIFNGKVHNYTDPFWVHLAPFKQLVDQLMPFVLEYVRTTHSVGCPHSIMNNFWNFFLSETNLYHRDILKFLLDNFVGFENVPIEEKKEKDEETVLEAGLGGMCGCCGCHLKNSLQAASHNRANNPNFITDMHKHSVGKFECPGCKAKFQSEEERDEHILQGNEETGCFGGQTSEDQELIREAIKRLFSSIIPMIEMFMRSKQLEWVDVFTLVDMFKTTVPVAKQEVAGQFNQFGYDISSRFGFGQKSIAQSCSIIQLDDVYAEQVVQLAIFDQQQQMNQSIQGYYSFASCYCCGSIINLVDIACGHKLCRDCIDGYFGTFVAEQADTMVVIKLPKCFCGSWYEETILPSFLRRLIQEYPKDVIEQMFSDSIIGECTCCHRIKGLQPRAGCGGDNTLQQSVCGDCLLRDVRLKTLIASNYNAFHPTKCKGCGVMYDHGEKGYGGIACSHTTCHCGFEQCKCCGMVFVNEHGEEENEVHYKFPSRVEYNGTVYWIYPPCFSDSHEENEEEENW